MWPLRFYPSREMENGIVELHAYNLHQNPARAHFLCPPTNDGPPGAPIRFPG
jgi:hypothetical protein